VWSYSWRVTESFGHFFRRGGNRPSTYVQIEI
jgi:hypothetical protein